ncbi:hypothetical protein FACS1894211_11730 [Clostridia bacterium]|nr:hypothetical protein FACS1894211_11730 [Clostridia bacterium]
MSATAARLTGVRADTVIRFRPIRSPIDFCGNKNRVWSERTKCAKRGIRRGRHERIEDT